MDDIENSVRNYFRATDYDKNQRMKAGGLGLKRCFYKNQDETTNLICTNNVGGSLNKSPDFFPMGTFIASTYMKL